jgi:hypothetical protein
MHQRLRDIDSQLEQRPTEKMMYKWIREECEKSGKEIREPIEKELEELRNKIEKLDGEQFRQKTSTSNSIAELRSMDEVLQKMIESEVVNTDKKVDH